MNIVTLDFETYFDDDYSLKKMTTEAYVRDPRFEVHGVAYRNEALGVPYTYWYTDADFRRLLAEKRLDFSNSAILCHHAHFDGLILSHHYGVKPRVWLDTLSMARLVLGNHVRVGLDSLASHFGLKAKSVPYNLFKGKHWSELSPADRGLVSTGAIHDCELTWQIFCLLAKEFPAEEYPIVDMTVRMFTEPKLRGDLEQLGKVWTDEAKRKATLLGDLGIKPEELQSADKFAQLLAAEGVEPATKDGKNGPIYAFAKTDQFMKDLIDDENPRIADLARARLGIKSTIDQTRAERLGYMAGRGDMPVYLSYCGAHTTRWSGGDRVNWQNFRRGGELRKAIQAPQGYKLGIVDLSQIECRILNYLAGQDDVVERFRKGEDPYVGIASKFYNRTITLSDKAERGTGKQAELSCGFGCGPAKFQATARLGIYGPPVIISFDDAAGFVDLYRRTHPYVVRYWQTATDVIQRLATDSQSFDWGPMRVEGRRIYLPNGAPLIYDTLGFDAESREWRIKTRNGYAKLYGGKLVENVIQALARVVLSQACIRIKNKLGLLPVLLAHDEGVWVLSEQDVELGAFEIIKQEMARTPEWLPGIPLAVEGSINERYEK